MEKFTARDMRKLANANYYVSIEEMRDNCRKSIHLAAASGKRCDRPFEILGIFEDEGMAKVMPQTFEKMIKELKADGFTVKVPKHLISRKPNYFDTIVRW